MFRYTQTNIIPAVKTGAAPKAVNLCACRNTTDPNNVQRFPSVNPNDCELHCYDNNYNEYRLSEQHAWRTCVPHLNNGYRFP